MEAWKLYRVYRTSNHLQLKALGLLVLQNHTFLKRKHWQRVWH